MGQWSIFHWLVVLIFYIVVIWIPLGKILKKAGYSPFWAILAIFPIINVIGLWIFAFSKWPAIEKNR